MSSVGREGVKAQVKKVMKEELFRLAADKGPGLLEKGMQGIANFSKKRKGELPAEKEETLYALVSLLKEEQDAQEKELEDLKEALTEQGKSILALEKTAEALSHKVLVWQVIAGGAGLIAVGALLVALLG